MTVTEWLATVAGAVLVGVALRDVFHTLLQPSGAGQLSTAIFRTIWRVARRAGVGAMDIAGPAGLVFTIAAWTAMLLAGCALMYVPHLPAAFVVADGLRPAAQDGVLDALYLSGTALTTLGFGDIVAESTALRLALVAEGVIGFALLTASISWVLSTYPALSRRRALASRIALLLAGEGDDVRVVGGDPPAVLAANLHGVADQIGVVRVDLIQYPATYFFHGPASDLSLPPALRRLDAAVRRDDLPAEVRTGAEAVVSSLAQLGETLRSGPFGLRVDDAGDALDRFAHDHAAPAR